MTVAVLVADDQPLFCSGIGMLLDAQPDLAYAGAAHSGAEAVQRTRELSPDVVLMDLRMPDGNGLDATRAVLRLPRPPRVLVLTTFRDASSTRLAREAGAAGFVTKDATPALLVGAIRDVAAGRAVRGAAGVTAMLSDPDPRPAADLGAIAALSPREQEVFLFAARGSSNADIAARCGISENTVRTHVSAVLAKLGAADRRELMRFAWRHGLLPPGDA